MAIKGIELTLDLARLGLYKINRFKSIDILVRFVFQLGQYLLYIQMY